MATDKQIKFAKTLGIENPEDFEVKALSKMIDEKMGGKPKMASTPTAQATLPTETTVINKTDKPNSYEIGRAGKRCKIYYNDTTELAEHIERLKTMGLLDVEDLVETQKI